MKGIIRIGYSTTTAVLCYQAPLGCAAVSAWPVKAIRSGAVNTVRQ